MNKFMKTMIMMGIVAAVAATTVSAQPVAVTGVSADYTSKYIWRGFNLFGSKGAFQPSVDMSLMGDSGLGLNVWGSFPVGSGYEEATELDYTLSWGTSLGEGATQTDIKVLGIYYDYPKDGSSVDVMEFGFSAGMPNLLPMGIGLSLYTGFMDGVDDGTSKSQYSSIGIGKDVEISDGLSLSLSADVNYNNDMLYSGSDWTHASFKATLCGIGYDNMTIKPFVGYTSSLVDGSQEKDDYPIADALFGGISVGISF